MKSEKLADELIVECIDKHLIQNESLNYSHERDKVNELLLQYTKEQIIYALNYYTNRGNSIPSFGYLKGNMDIPCSLYQAEMYHPRGNTFERNWNRITAKHHKTECRKDYPEYLFAETGTDY